MIPTNEKAHQPRLDLTTNGDPILGSERLTVERQASPPTPSRATSLSLSSLPHDATTIRRGKDLGLVRLRFQDAIFTDFFPKPRSFTI